MLLTVLKRKPVSFFLLFLKTPHGVFKLLLRSFGWGREPSSGRVHLLGHRSPEELGHAFRKAAPAPTPSL